MSKLSQDFSDLDQVWMQRAIELARLGQYSTKPNPNVGCVIVNHGQKVGEGFHPRAGQPHAEVFALRQAGELAQGATAYVTLEPCAHYGRTPPCAKGLVNAGIKRVIVACPDPNPLVAGKGVSILREAGIDVQVGCCEPQAHQLNEGFLKAMATGMPYLRLKIASSLDGRTAMASGESKWITGPEARQDVQHWRAISGVVITGINTVLADDCQLNVRQLIGVDDLSDVVQPKRLILDRQGRLPLQAKILQQPETVMVMGPYRQALADLGVTQLAIQDLSDLCRCLVQDFQIYDVMIEAGATLSTVFLQEKLVDEVISYVAPTFLGQSASAMFHAKFNHMAEQLRFKLIDVTPLGEDIRLRLKPSQETV
ncbi:MULTISPECIES: bifunctional diaminohydroxyphosphoribosylaminopyrimidine deaminase/5-amino-6-(5-phosphoribosylamino)uracil reductase RibD [unclassified Acinetobacter]|uniref:bifunctional diaminohydroxyphosphoribosylaminopyrimidine deaminase/5-amino-6-(5-phosphoribosylamino)uracil reductase RibD n=1 Tax=unclassified Acinetobacter TaxID=196816 RepID=UPI00293482FE|nr:MULTISPECIES: bifunctional diaminohydroxyphosphoribosylaminopyrimidine deaminase/5-amino-6-(5-phosphoribosylamino)uracil reductase RibD [unclassified Acinetobacter]WOE30683.1 bifunctional diaminohydroxyphosphoribosylaminopyrimidine deaminase/5-amino-6-(5-phosphoribosylamino)uracil reductase RibD [Acinetobacter sp. SAAs470]WOE38876.1 bifunctional diaminohydroxyphosphoribosylaminopyrimidine deaminase/5-amino-6-(5-phosphoribosylamino)uracil reductase RibD [Acinetobacter sp. SAAs474]